jgi:hypothetical protein
METIETDVRTDGPIPLSCYIDENGFKICSFRSKELKSYVEKHPDVIFEVKDQSGRFFKYQNTSFIWNAMIAGELPV